MMTDIIAFLVGTLSIGSPEYQEKVEEQQGKGYTWEYTGATDWTQEESPSLLLQSGEFHPYVLFKLTKPDDE
tara:strand:- start:23 stop:238 length:216 start_codon:yes stop_codon:yes gene_type:complete